MRSPSTPRLFLGALRIAVGAALVTACAAGPVPPSSTPGSVAPDVASACPSPGPSAVAELRDLARRGPASGVWVGVHLDWANETVAKITQDLGRAPADLVTFVSFPLTADDGRNLDAAAEQAREVGAVMVITLQPWNGLVAATDEAATELAGKLAGYGAAGVPTIIRFAHEMNGSWYPWGQDPDAYIAAFRRVADAIHAGAPTAAMLWAPNQGEGYPYFGGKYAAVAGSPAARRLDTNHDGRLTAADDPYAPYWPGPQYVDWVGMSLYHWGTAYPWGENEVPAAGKFTQLITGAGGQQAVPDFYAAYSETFGKPMAIAETAAFYRPGGGGASEEAIKTAWLDQVFSPSVRTNFPLLRLVNWFEWRKQEAEVKAVVDWRITADPALRTAFRGAMTDGFALGPAVPASVPVASGCAEAIAP